MSISINQFTPLHDYLLLKQDERLGVSKGGIILTEKQERPPQTGKVVKAGPGKVNDKGVREALEFKVGDKLMFQLGEFKKLTFDEGEYILVKQDAIIGVFDE